MEEQEREKRHPVKSPSGLGHMLSMVVFSLATVINGFLIWHSEMSGIRVVLLCALAVSLLYCTAVFVRTWLQSAKRSTELVLAEGKLTLHGTPIEAREIRLIMRMGYFRPLVGVRLHGKRGMPFNRCFRFVADEDEGMADLAQWSARNQVKMAEKSFTFGI